MNLLDLPPELFQHIIHELVSTGSLFDDFDDGEENNVWSLRSVCRTFAAEIEHDVLNNQPKEFLNVSYHEKLMKPCMDRYLFNRLMSPRDVSRKFLAKVKDMVDYVIEELCIGDQQREQHTEKILHGFSKILGFDNIAHSLWCDTQEDCRHHPTGWHRETSHISYRLCAALAISAHGLFNRLLTEFALLEANSSFQPSLVEMALDISDKGSLHTVLQGLDTLQSADPGLAMGLIKRQEALYPVSNFIKRTVGEDDVDATRSLLNFYEKHFGRPCKRIYMDWILSALAHSHPVAEYPACFHTSDFNFKLDKAKKTLNTVLSFKPGEKSMVTKWIIRLIYEYGGHSDTMEALGLIRNVNSGTVFNLPIFMAVRYQNPLAMRAVLEAGADANVKVKSNIPSVHKTKITPLDSAIHRNSSYVADELIKGGATMPHVSEWPTRKGMYNILRSHTCKRSKSAAARIPSVEKFRAMSQDDRKALQY